MPAFLITCRDIVLGQVTYVQILIHILCFFISLIRDIAHTRDDNFLLISKFCLSHRSAEFLKRGKNKCKTTKTGGKQPRLPFPICKKLLCYHHGHTAYIFADMALCIWAKAFLTKMSYRICQNCYAKIKYDEIMAIHNVFRVTCIGLHHAILLIADVTLCLLSAWFTSSKESNYMTVLEWENLQHDFILPL